MKIIVISDTHGNAKDLENIILKHKDADLFLHLGDGAKEFLQIKSIYPDLPMEIVRGNCDFEHDFLPDEKTFIVICGTFGKHIYDGRRCRGERHQLHVFLWKSHRCFKHHFVKWRRDWIQQWLRWRYCDSEHGHL